MVGQAVMVFGHAVDRRLEVHAADENGDDAGGIGLQGQLGQVEHQPGPADVVGTVGASDGRRLVHHRLGPRHPRLVGVKLLLHVAHGIGVIRHLLLIAQR